MFYLLFRKSKDVCMCVWVCYNQLYRTQSVVTKDFLFIILHLSLILLFFQLFLWHFVQFAGEYLIFWFLSILICNGRQLRTFLFVYVTTACGDLKLWQCDLWFIYFLYYVPACLLSCILSKQHHFYFHYTEINIKSQYWKLCWFMCVPPNTCIF